MNHGLPPDAVPPETKLLDKHPTLRGHVSSLPEFNEWRRGLNTVTVDDITYYVRGGDMLKDEDQIMAEWIRCTHPEFLADEEE
ncbi:hypothetical protein [Rhodococcus opacus]|uniref:hypothetical protein n=1 Tax=Rhodococcus opacus TaxID=37919 RepID=UPI002953E877|nr:hypothetical protein [Rhodococcus opacus]MDV7088655.1 hypothetical protein [Rhodococcus opacus]